MGRSAKKINEAQDRAMKHAEDMNCEANILEAGVANTFKQYGEWSYSQQAEISIRVLQRAVELRKQADRIMKNVHLTLGGRRSRTRSRRRR